MKTLLDNEHQKIILENGIVLQIFKMSYLDLKTTQILTEDRVKSFGEKSYPLLSNIRSVKHSSRKARAFFASEKGCENIVAAALLVDSTFGSMISNFFVKVTNPIIPTKAFSNEIEAKKWLTQYVKND